MSKQSKRRWRIVHSESSTGWGGQEHRTLAELMAFGRRGNDVWLFAPTESQIFRRTHQRGLAVKPVGFGRRQFLSSVLQSARLLSQIRPDVLNTHSSRDGWIVVPAGRI